jgi:magnesium-transporting ATPase (P-type)
MDYSVHTYFTKRKNKKGEEIVNKKNESIIIDHQNFLLRGCSLRQTESVLCFVVYTGKNTKIMQNSPSSRAKTSSLEKRMNSQIKYIFLFQLILSLTASFFSLIQIIRGGGNPTPYLNGEENTSYVNFEEYSKKIYKIIFETNYKKIFNKKDSIFIIIKNLFKEISPIFDIYVLLFFLLKLGTWCVLMNNLVPISLLMTMELVKYFQGWFISWDIDIYDKEKHIMTKVQTSTLNEELGQVKYIFSDKTGTLTKNYMNFKRVTIGYNQYNKPKIKDIENSSIIFNNKKEKEKENKSDIIITVNGNIKEENKDKKDNIDNTNCLMIKDKIMTINGTNDKKNKNNEMELYEDDYGIITNVLFLDDKQLKEDMKLNPSQRNDKEKLNKDIKDKDSIGSDSNSSNEEGDEDNNSLNNNIDYNMIKQKSEKIMQK